MACSRVQQRWRSPHPRATAAAARGVSTGPRDGTHQDPLAGLISSGHGLGFCSQEGMELALSHRLPPKPCRKAAASGVQCTLTKLFSNRECPENRCCSCKPECRLSGSIQAPLEWREGRAWPPRFQEVYSFESSCSLPRRPGIQAQHSRSVLGAGGAMGHSAHFSYTLCSKYRR